MEKKFVRILITVFGLFVGFGLVWVVFKNRADLGIANLLDSIPSLARTIIFAFFSVVFGIIFYISAPKIVSGVVRMTKRVEREMRELSMKQIFVGVIGLLLGLIIAALISTLIQKIPFSALRLLLNVIVFFVLAYLGWRIPTTRAKEINLPNWFKRGEGAQQEAGRARPKLLDTSAIIDGRFFDAYKTGIIEGKVIVPRFILDELRHIADSPDALKRARGRRGIDAINALQKEHPEVVLVSDTDYPELSEADTKLLRMALETGGIVVTNDYNLNRVAAVQSVPVFNINDLANSLRLNVVAGEPIDVAIVKEGKEPGQGVAYFDDGTMVVVDGAGGLVGESVAAVVTSVLQTSAGKMVFAKIDEA